VEDLIFFRCKKTFHIDCIGEALRIAQDKADEKNFYGWNPAFDKKH